MAQYHYTIFFVPLDEGGYKVIVPAIPEICTFGLTMEKRESWRGMQSGASSKAPAIVVDMSSPASMWPRSCERGICRDSLALQSCNPSFNVAALK